MKKVLFALTPAQKLANGSATYTDFILRQAIKHGKLFDVYYNPQNNSNPEFTIDILPKTTNVFKCTTLSEVENLLASNRYDVLFLGSETDSDAKMSKSITPIITVHDLRYMEVTGDKYRHFYRKSRFGRLKQILLNRFYPMNESNAQKKRISKFINHPKLEIVTVSNHTKYSILYHFPHVPEEKIHVFYSPSPGMKEQFNYREENDFFNKHNIKQKEYFLIISAGRWFKNSYRAIKAFDHLCTKKAMKNKKVVVLGVLGSKKIMEVKNKKSFVFIDYVSSETLQLLLANAFGFIYPSLQEGFGIPPLDAMQYGTPVLASAATAISEVCSYGAHYFNPYSVQEIENRIMYLLNDSSFYNSCSELGRKRRKELDKIQKADLDKLLSFIFD